MIAAIIVHASLVILYESCISKEITVVSGYRGSLIGVDGNRFYYTYDKRHDGCFVIRHPFLNDGNIQYKLSLPKASNGAVIKVDFDSDNSNSEWEVIANMQCDRFVAYSDFSDSICVFNKDCRLINTYPLHAKGIIVAISFESQTNLLVCANNRIFTLDTNTGAIADSLIMKSNTKLPAIRGGVQPNQHQHIRRIRNGAAFVFTDLFTNATRIVDSFDGSILSSYDSCDLVETLTGDRILLRSKHHDDIYVYRVINMDNRECKPNALCPSISLSAASDINATFTVGVYDSECLSNSGPLSAIICNALKIMGMQGKVCLYKCSYSSAGDELEKCIYHINIQQVNSAKSYMAFNPIIISPDLTTAVVPIDSNTLVILGLSHSTLTSIVRVFALCTLWLVVAGMVGCIVILVSRIFIQIVELDPFARRGTS